MNWQNIRVSMLDSVQSTHPRSVTLSAWVKATKTSRIDTPKRDRPALMPHGHFVGGRSADHCREASGLVQFDIDRKDNPDLDVDRVKRQCAHIPSIVFCAKSATGGVYGLAIRASDLDNQLDGLERGLDVRLDKANSRSVAALRFASTDPSPYEHL